MAKVALPATITTKQDVDELINELHSYLTWFRANAIKEQVHAKKGTPPPVISDEAHQLIRITATKKQLDASVFEELIESLEHYRSQAPIISITLAAPAAKPLKTSLTTWFRDNISADALLSFTYNRTILGGMVVRCGSHIYDWSFRRQLHEQRDRFPEVLSRV